MDYSEHMGSKKFFPIFLSNFEMFTNFLFGQKMTVENQQFYEESNMFDNPSPTETASAEDIHFHDLFFKKSPSLFLTFR